MSWAGSWGSGWGSGWGATPASSYGESDALWYLNPTPAQKEALKAFRAALEAEQLLVPGFEDDTTLLRL